MKTINHYMQLPYKLEIIPDLEEGGYVGLFPELPGCITCADKLEDLIADVMDAKRSWLEAMLEAGMDIPEPGDFAEYSGQFKLRLPKSLHKQLAENSKREGISMNQYCVYLLARNDALVMSRRENEKGC